MSQRPLRFVHASDLHLEQPLYGLEAIPDSFRSLLIDAPFKAAERVFEAAVLEEADFLLLAGDVLNPETAGPRAIQFLLDQFQILSEHGVAVYWAGGADDGPDRWPAAIPLPEGVHLFERGRVEDISHFRDDAPIATILGTSWNGEQDLRVAEFHSDAAAPFNVAVAYGECAAESLAAHSVHYWALGGRHRRKPLVTGPLQATYSGTPQGRCPDEDGPHGCTVVHVDEHGKIRTQVLVTDVVRFHKEQVTLSAGLRRQDLDRLLSDRMKSLLTEAGDHPTLVTWQIQSAGTLGGVPRNLEMADELTERLRRDFSSGNRQVWTASVEFLPPKTLPKDYYEEDTILGDFLRLVRTYQAEQTGMVSIASLIPDHYLDSGLVSGTELADLGDRDAVLRDVAMLGVDLLSGSE